MKEILVIRINLDYAYMLFGTDEGRNIGTSVKIVELSKDDPRYFQIPIIEKEVMEKYNRGFYYGWEFKRSYTKNELTQAKLLHMKINTTFEPCGEEYGTLYDETVACKFCGANRKQTSPLFLKKASIPKKDIARTIAGEVIVSEKFAAVVNQEKLKGILLEPVICNKLKSNYFQLSSSECIDLSSKTETGCGPFDSFENSCNIESDKSVELNIPGGYHIMFEQEVYKCPKGDTVGLNLLSEPFVLNSSIVYNCDFMESKQKIGVKRGLLRPESLYFCSQKFKKMVVENRLTGFDFEIARIV